MKLTIDSRRAEPVAQDLQARHGAPALDGAVDERLLALPDGVLAHRRLELEDQPGPDRFDDGRGARLLAVLRVGQVDVLLGVDVGHGAAAHDGRHAVGNSSRRATSTPGVPGPPMNLWGDRKIASL